MTGPRIRILSHQACTGGTIISRLVASAENVVLLSEISPAGPVSPTRFDPLTPLTQFADLYPDLAPEAYLRGEFVTRQIAKVLRACENAERHLVLREHAHSEWFFEAAGGATLRALTGTLGATATVVTVRHPAASYLSLCRAFPTAFDVDFGTYCERYLAYLDAANPVAVEAYEPFCRDPFGTVARLFRAWGLADTAIPDRTKWQEIVRTGDSGRARGARRIKPAALPPTDTRRLTATIRYVSTYTALCDRLGYDPDVTAYAEELARAALLADFTALDTPAGGSRA